MMSRSIEFLRRKRGTVLPALLLAVIILCSPIVTFAANAGETAAGKYEGLTLIPGGMPFGVRLYTRGVLVVSITEVVGSEGRTAPALEAGLKTKDLITAIDGKEVSSVDEVSALIGACEGKALTLIIERDGNEQSVVMTPSRSLPDGAYRAGIWIRDSTAGIGTVSYINPANRRFSGLGHGICDSDTGVLLTMRKSVVSGVMITGVVKGVRGTPGELKGTLSPVSGGYLTSNSNSGVCGVLDEIPEGTGKAIPVATRVHTGNATIYCTIGDGGVKEYSISIVKITNDSIDGKNFVVRVTDERLLDATGGIVQGMSGSPIIQDGRLVGAVTHVLVNEPTEGYGICVWNMLAGMPEILAKAKTE